MPNVRGQENELHPNESEAKVLTNDEQVCDDISEGSWSVLGSETVTPGSKNNSEQGWNKTEPNSAMNDDEFVDVDHLDDDDIFELEKLGSMLKVGNNQSLSEGATAAPSASSSGDIMYLEMVEMKKKSLTASSESSGFVSSGTSESSGSSSIDTFPIIDKYEHRGQKKKKIERTEKETITVPVRVTHLSNMALSMSSTSEGNEDDSVEVQMFLEDEKHHMNVESNESISTESSSEVETSPSVMKRASSAPAKFSPKRNLRFPKILNRHQTKATSPTKSSLFWESASVMKPNPVKMIRPNTPIPNKVKTSPETSPVREKVNNSIPVLPKVGESKANMREYSLADSSVTRNSSTTAVNSSSHDENWFYNPSKSTSCDQNGSIGRSLSGTKIKSGDKNRSATPTKSIKQNETIPVPTKSLNSRKSIFTSARRSNTTLKSGSQGKNRLISPRRPTRSTNSASHDEHRSSVKRRSISPTKSISQDKSEFVLTRPSPDLSKSTSRRKNRFTMRRQAPTPTKSRSHKKTEVAATRPSTTPTKSKSHNKTEIAATKTSTTQTKSKSNEEDKDKSIVSRPSSSPLKSTSDDTYRSTVDRPSTSPIRCTNNHSKFRSPNAVAWQYPVETKISLSIDGLGAAPRTVRTGDSRTDKKHAAVVDPKDQLKINKTNPKKIHADGTLKHSVVSVENQNEHENISSVMRDDRTQDGSIFTNTTNATIATDTTRKVTNRSIRKLQVFGPSVAIISEKDRSMLPPATTIRKKKSGNKVLKRTTGLGKTSKNVGASDMVLQKLPSERVIRHTKIETSKERRGKKFSLRLW